MNEPTDLENITFAEGHGGLPKILIETPWSSAEIYLHGAHVTHFQKKAEAPLLFLSQSSAFLADQPIRGGVPIIFPWFGPREGSPAHGFARTAEWDLTARSVQPDGSVKLYFRLPAVIEVEFVVTVGQTLEMELRVRNTGEVDYTFESCLHTYFHISAIDTIEITGLVGVTYLDKVTGATTVESIAPLHIASEVDRIYQDTTAAVEIHDPDLKRTIRVEKSGSNSTVVWNPWIDKSQRMADFGDDEYLQMVCVESGNVAAHKITLAPAEIAVMKVEVSSRELSHGGRLVE